MKKNWLFVIKGLAVSLAVLGSPARAERALDDATILAIFDQANAADIYTGRLGAKYGHSQDVRALGHMVATDHVTVQQMGRDLAKKLDVLPTPPDNDMAIADHAKSVSLLQSKTGVEFDKAYLRNDIVFHQSVIDAVKGTLLPATKSGELKKLLSDVLPGFEQHLSATKAVAKKLGIE